MKKFVLTCILCLVFSQVQAGESDKRKEVERLLQLTQVDKMVDTMYTQMDQMMSGLGQQLGVKPAEQALLDKYMKKLTAAMRQEMNWEKMRAPMIDLYLKSYTAKEIQDMIGFYQSETGKSVVNKQSAVMQESMSISETMVQDFLPRIQEIAMELEQEIDKARQQN